MTASSSDVNRVFSKAFRQSLICESRLAPIKAVVITEFFSTQASAIWARL